MHSHERLLVMMMMMMTLCRCVLCVERTRRKRRRRVNRNQTRPLPATDGHVPRDHDVTGLQLHTDTSPGLFLGSTHHHQQQQQQQQTGDEVTTAERNPDIETLGELETDNDTSGLLFFHHNIVVKSKLKSFPSHKAHRAALISISSDTGLVYRAVCPFTPQLLLLIAPTH